MTRDSSTHGRRDRRRRGRRADAARAWRHVEHVGADAARACRAYLRIRPDLPGLGSLGSRRGSAIARRLRHVGAARARGSRCRARARDRAFDGNDRRRSISRRCIRPWFAASRCSGRCWRRRIRRGRTSVRAGQKARSEGVAGMQEIADALVQAATSSTSKQKRHAAVAFVRESLMRQSPDGYARSCEALADMQAVDTSKIACPTLLVTGDEDVVAPPQSVRQMGDRIAGSGDARADRGAARLRSLDAGRDAGRMLGSAAAVPRASSA